MKNIITILSLVFTLNLLAEDKAPAPFKDSGIKRKLKNGKVQKFDGNKYKIVRRGGKKRPPKKQRTYKKNTVKVFLGYGPDDLDKTNTGRVDLDNNPFVGLGYQRMLNEEFSVEAIGTSNQSLMIGGGFSF